MNPAGENIPDSIPTFSWAAVLMHIHQSIQAFLQQLFIRNRNVESWRRVTMHADRILSYAPEQCQCTKLIEVIGPGRLSFLRNNELNSTENLAFPTKALLAGRMDR